MTGESLWIRSMEFCGRYARCHQMPERSFFIRGYQLPLCARCTGIMIGNIIGLMTFWIDFPLWTALLMIPMALDGTVQRFTDYESNNRRRLITGLLWGFASVAMTFFLIRFLIYFLT